MRAGKSAGHGEIYCYGEAMVLVAPVEPGPLAGRPLCSLSPAGAEFNVAAHLAGLGCGTQWISALGNDPLSEIILGEARDRGVGTDYVAVDTERPTGLYLKSSEPDGTRMLYYRRRSAASAFDLVQDVPPSLHRPSIIHTTGITPALSDVTRQSVGELVCDRAYGPAMVSFDVNYRPALWDGGHAPDVLLSVAQHSDIVFVGRDEAETVWGTPTAEDIRRLIDQPRHLVVKDGAESAVEFDGDSVTVCSAPAVDVLEPVGAGDAFAAGWLTGFVRGEPAVRRLRFGHFMASQALQHHGDIFPPVGRDRIGLALELPVESWGPELLVRKAEAN